MWPVLSYVTTVEWRPCDSGSALAFSVILQDPHSLQLTCTDILSINVINCGFVVLVCTCDIYCMSVCPGRGISPLWLILRFLPSIYFWVKKKKKQKKCLFSIWQVFPHSNRGPNNRRCCPLYRLLSPLRQCDWDFGLEYLQGCAVKNSMTCKIHV